MFWLLSKEFTVLKDLIVPAKAMAKLVMTTKTTLNRQQILEMNCKVYFNHLLNVKEPTEIAFPHAGFFYRVRYPSVVICIIQADLQVKETTFCR